jgi:hypothetical protein
MKKMNVVNLTLGKKGRKYWACKLSGKHDARLLIDCHTESLEAGKTYDLKVYDFSVKNKYGSKLEFVAAGNIEKEQKDPYLIYPKAYNELLREEAKKISGKWDSEESCWVFPSIAEEEAEELDYLFNSEPVTVEITAKKRPYDDYHSEGHGPITFMGYTIAKAYDRDSGADVADGVVLVEGEVTSGGSRANWKTMVKTGTRFRLEVSKPLLDHLKEYEEAIGIWDFKEIQSNQKEKTSEKIILLGYAMVDSGQLLVVDPCYVKDGMDYDSLIEEANDQISSKCFKKAGPYATGIRLRQFGGDGSFPVYGKFNSNWSLTEVTIKFQNEGTEES